MTSLITNIKQLSLNYLDEIIEIRRHLHKNPELSFHEFQTSKFIAKKLTEMGIDVVSDISGTAVIGIIQGKTDAGKTIALRADMDALPIDEINSVSYKSIKPGVMHACGHDVHMASLLGTAKILKELNQHFNGLVKLIFQPAEELLPGGAIKLIGAGVLKNPNVDIIIAQHVDPMLEKGFIGMKSGAYMASNDELYITVEGTGGHAALIDQEQNSVFLLSQAIADIRRAFNNTVQEDTPFVLSIGKIVADGATNVVPDIVKAEGTFRTFNEGWRSKALNLMLKIVTSSTNGLGYLEVVKGYPTLVNDPEITAECYGLVSEILGKKHVVTLDKRMTAEDFAWYAQKIPALFYRLGVGNESKGIKSKLHTSTFNVDENVLCIGMEVMAYATIGMLQNADKLAS